MTKMLKKTPLIFIQNLFFIKNCTNSCFVTTTKFKHAFKLMKLRGKTQGHLAKKNPAKNSRVCEKKLKDFFYKTLKKVMVSAICHPRVGN